MAGEDDRSRCGRFGLEDTSRAFVEGVKRAGDDVRDEVVSGMRQRY